MHAYESMYEYCAEHEKVSKEIWEVFMEEFAFSNVHVSDIWLDMSMFSKVLV